MNKSNRETQSMTDYAIDCGASPGTRHFVTALEWVAKVYIDNADRFSEERIDAIIKAFGDLYDSIADGEGTVRLN